MPMLYKRFFSGVKDENFQKKSVDIFNIFAKGEAVLTSTHNLSFWNKNRKKGIPLHTPRLLHKSGV